MVRVGVVEEDEDDRELTLEGVEKLTDWVEDSVGATVALAYDVDKEGKVLVVVLPALEERR